MASPPDPRPTAPSADQALAAPHRGPLAAGWAKFSDNAIPSLVVAIIAGLVLFSFTKTSGRISRLDDRITRLEHDIDARFTKLEHDIDARFTKLEDDIDARFTKLEDDIDARFTRLETEINARFTRLETEINARFAAVDARFTSLEKNQHEITLTLARLVALMEAREAVPSVAPG